MNIDVLVAFGGVALIGAVGFAAAWFSSKAPGKPSTEGAAKTKAEQKERVIARIAHVEEELHSVSSQIANL